MAKRFLHHHRSVSRLQAVSVGASCNLSSRGAGRDTKPTLFVAGGSAELRHVNTVPVLEIVLAQGIGNKRVKVKVLARLETMN